MCVSNGLLSCCGLSGVHHGYVAGAEQCRLIIEHHSDWNPFKQCMHTPFVAESLGEAQFLELGQNLRSYAAAYKHSAQRQELKRRITGRCAIDLDENIDRVLAKRTL